MTWQDAVIAVVFVVVVWVVCVYLGRVD